jgi:hypothetical protein
MADLWIDLMASPYATPAQWVDASAHIKLAPTGGAVALDSRDMTVRPSVRLWRAGVRRAARR